MKVALIMGSNSDWPVLEPAEKTLKDFGVEVEVVVASAHRTPELVKEFAAGARDRGVEVIIAAAGAAAHLGGVIASYTTLPVIGVPINATALNGVDALLSFVQMPSGNCHSLTKMTFLPQKQKGHFLFTYFVKGTTPSTAWAAVIRCPSWSRSMSTYLLLPMPSSSI